MPLTEARPAPLRISLLGLGTVGLEVARALLERSDELAHAAGRPLVLVTVGVREPDRDRGLALPAEVAKTEDLPAAAMGEGVDVVVELLGGLEPAGALVSAVLGEGRAVVTANKALLARQGPALERASRACAAPLRFEAAVAGGIPVLSSLARDLAANRWQELLGILNGTTNHILSAMTDEGLDYAEVLADAQARGYAEADPAGDVEGRDAADKLTLLCRLAFGAWLQVDAIRRSLPSRSGGEDGPPGITGVTADEIARAAEAGLVIKLVAHARRAHGGAVAASVLPSAVPAGSPLGRTGGVTNMVVLRGEPIGELRLAGPGAGGAATSSAVLADLLALARGEGSTWASLPEAGGPEAPIDGLEAVERWFERYPIVEAA